MIPRGRAAAGAGGDFASSVLEAVDAIPPGKVLTYGDVAAAIGSRSARGVGQVMAYHGSDVPWWRVIRADGRAAIGKESQALEHFRVEGTPLIRSSAGGWRVDLGRARHVPRFE